MTLPRWLILSALLPVALALYLLLAVVVGRRLKASREAAPLVCDCEECSPDPWARLK